HSTVRAGSDTYTVKWRTQRLTHSTSASASRSRGAGLAYRGQSAISTRIDARASRARRPGDSSLASVTITARKLALFTKNAGTTPKRPITTPATAGPTMRAALNAAEFSATALATSSLPTRSITYDWRAGWSKTLAK